MDRYLNHIRKRMAYLCIPANNCFHYFYPKILILSFLQNGTKSSKRQGKDVVIKNGQLISGVIDKASIGAEEPDSVLHRIAKDYGNDDAKKFLDSILIMLKTYITHRGFSYGYSDLWLNDETRKEILDVIDKTYNKINELVLQYQRRYFTFDPGLIS